MIINLTEEQMGLLPQHVQDMLIGIAKEQHRRHEVPPLVMKPGPTEADFRANQRKYHIDGFNRLQPNTKEPR